MGSWNETCAITNMPIFPGTNVKMVMFKPRLTEDNPHFQSHVRRMVSDFECTYRCFVDIYSGDYDSYGSIEDCEEIPEFFEQDYQYFFVDSSVWDTIVSFAKNNYEYQAIVNHYENCVPVLRDTPINSEDFLLYPVGKEDKFKELMYILSFAERTNRDVWVGDTCRGRQEVYYNEHELIANQIQNMIVLGRKRSDEDVEEEVEEDEE